MDAEPEIVAHAHHAYVQHINGGQHAGWHFGVCGACGWNTFDIETEADAQAAVDAHIASTGYRWDYSTQRMEPRC